MSDVNFCTMPHVGVYQGRYKWRVYPSQNELLKLINAGLNPFVEQVTIRQLDLIRVSTDGDTLSSSTGRLADPSAAIPPVRETDTPEESDPVESGKPTESGAPQGSAPVSSEPPPAQSGEPPVQSQPAASDPPAAPTGGDPALSGGPDNGDWGDTPD